MLTHARKLLSRVSLSEAIAQPKYSDFRIALARTTDVKWLTDLQVPTLWYVAQQFSKNRQKPDARIVYPKMLNDLEPRHTAADFARPDGTATTLSILASIDEISISEFFFRIMQKYSQTGDFKGYEIEDLKIDGHSDTDIPIIEAAKTGSLNTVYVLILFGANVNQPELKHHNTALHKACELMRLDMVESLVGQGADPTLRNRCGKLPLDMVADLQNRQLLSQAIQSGHALRNKLKFRAVI